ncbi:MAG TPA: cardiolipin synthase [Tepidisphaeraceae bacterium]|jgi:cardiolipin synthase
MRLRLLCRLVCLGLILTLGSGCFPHNRYRYSLQPLYGVDDPQFRRTMGTLLGPPLVEGNSVAVLLNGDQIFPAMLEAIHSAQKTITFETFVYWSGEVGREFADALTERASAGVKVHVILDAVGSDKIDHSYIKRMRDAGVEIEKYHPLRWYDLSSAKRLNNRTHRKLLVVDGKVGFTGGVGIADEWLGHAQDSQHWRDTHFKVEGPAVGQLQAAFMDNWIETHGWVLHGDDYFPPLEKHGELVAQVFQSSSQGGSESMELMYLLAISAAKHHLRICASYFVPDALTIRALKEAGQRGVAVEIIVPGKKIDEKLVRQASRARWGDLLEAGVKIYEYQPAMYHCKVMIVDDLWVSIGSSNFDARSFKLNDEANLNVLDAKFAARQTEVFEEDLQHSKQISYQAWKHRPFGQQWLDGMSALLSPEL